MCGNRVGTIILPPAVWGNINYRQSESKFDENREYKEEYKNEIKVPENNER